MNYDFSFNQLKANTDIWHKEVNRLVHTPNGTIMQFVVDDGWHFSDPGHPAEQVTLVTNGEIEWHMDGQVYHLKAGDGVYVPPHMPHGGKLLSGKASGIDIFMPQRTEKPYKQGLRFS